MGTRVTLETIYEEVRKVNERLTLIEEAVEEVVTKGLPEVKIQKKKMSEIEQSVQEIKRGNCVTLEELKSA
jgi:predicted transcriptional regulator